jgi:hypothetical protein
MTIELSAKDGSNWKQVIPPFHLENFVPETVPVVTGSKEEQKAAVESMRRRQWKSKHKAIKSLTEKKRAVNTNQDEDEPRGVKRLLESEEGQEVASGPTKKARSDAVQAQSAPNQSDNMVVERQDSTTT